MKYKKPRQSKYICLGVNYLQTPSQHLRVFSSAKTFSQNTDLDLHTSCEYSL